MTKMDIQKWIYGFNAVFFFFLENRNQFEIKHHRCPQKTVYRYFSVVHFHLKSFFALSVFFVSHNI